jgi:hypothetical protein
MRRLWKVNVSEMTARQPSVPKFMGIKISPWKWKLAKENPCEANQGDERVPFGLKKRPLIQARAFSHYNPSSDSVKYRLCP